MNDALRRLSFAAYAVALFFVLSPIADVITNAWPLNLGNEQWRYGFAGITSNYLVSVLFGAILASLVAAAAEHRLLLKILGISLAVCAGLLFIMLIGLTLDAFQMISIVRPEQLGMFKIGAAKAAMKIGAVSGVMIILSISCIRAGKTLATRTERETASLIRA